MNYNFCLFARIEIRFINGCILLSEKQLSLSRVLPRVQPELGINHLPRQRKDVERPEDEVIPMSSQFETSDFVVTSRLVLNCQNNNR